MGIIHTPRTLYAVAKGFWRRGRSNQDVVPLPEVAAAGIGRDNPHLYTAHVGLFDVDYLGHMNNASYLSHAEYARWQMCAENGLLSAMWRHRFHFVVLGASVRYRKELRPLFRSFRIETTIAAVDESNNMWIVHNFRHQYNDTKQQNKQRLVAQVLVQGAAIQGRDRIDPAELLTKHVGIDEVVVNNLRLSSTSSTTTPSNDDGSSSSSDDYNEMIHKYIALQQSLQQIASNDDREHV